MAIINTCSVVTHKISEDQKRWSYHPSRIIMISMDSENRQANIEIWILIIHLAKSNTE
jgi:hypothetical protein